MNADTLVIYSVASSLDGFHTDASGGFDWAVPDEEVMAALNEDLAGVSTQLYGRRMYETMAVWETDPAAAGGSPESERFAEIWRAAEKIVFSSTLARPWTERTRLERELTPEAVQRARDAAAGDLTVDGPVLAASALRLGVVDVVELLLCPVVVGGGSRVLPPDLRLDLTLERERVFGNGMVQLRYRVAG